MRIVTILTVVCLAMAACVAASAAQVQPLGVTSRTIGGGNLNDYTHGVSGGIGINNIGLLVRLWGRVTFCDTDNKVFYIDDGLGRNDGSGHVGVRVSYDNLAPDLPQNEVFSPPEANSTIAVTGISSTWVWDQKVQPMLRPRRGSDLTVFSL